MPVDNSKNGYNLDRKAAGELLGVSTRTVDRYVKVGKLSTRVDGGRVWLNSKEIADFISPKQGVSDVDNVSTSPVYMSIDGVDTEVDSEVDRIDNVDNVEILGQDEGRSSKFFKKGQRGEIYKKLYLELKEDLKEKQDRLEIANYRVGQLETQVRSSIPLLEYRRETFERDKVEKALGDELKEVQELLKNNAAKIRYEKFTKRIFIVVLLTLLALQPLWLILINSSQ